MSLIISNIQEIEIKEKTLTKIKVDQANWIVHYLDETTGEKWLKEYPNSSYHGAGAPQLRKVEKFE